MLHRTRRARPIAATAPAAVAALSSWLCAAAGCDAARDVGYAGEPLHVVALTIAPGASGAVQPRVGLFWLAPDGAHGQAHEAARDTRLVGRALQASELHVLRPPSALREVDGGSLAIGMLVAYDDADEDGARDEGERVLGAARELVVFAPDGIAGAFTTLPRGFSTVLPSGPCDADPISFHPRLLPRAAAIVLNRDFDPARLFDARDCIAAWEASPGLDLGVWRWLCRFGPHAPGRGCAYEMRKLFPEGADDATCDAWRETQCPNHAEGDECDAEWQVCRGGEPPARWPCDLACACAASTEVCIEDGGERAFCEAKDAACVWR